MRTNRNITGALRALSNVLDGTREDAKNTPTGSNITENRAVKPQWKLTIATQGKMFRALHVTFSETY